MEPAAGGTRRPLALAFVFVALALVGYLGWVGARPRMTPEAVLRTLEEADADLLAARLEEAERKFRRAAAADPADARAVFGVGLALVRQGRLGEGLEALDRAAVLAPANNDHAYVRAQTLSRLGRRDEAIVAYESIVRSDPDRAEAAGEMIGLLADAGRWEEARRAVSSAVTQAPGRYPLRILAGRIECRLGAHEAAREHYEMARRIRPAAPVPVRGLLEESRHLGRLDEAGALTAELERLEARARENDRLKEETRARPADPEAAARYAERLLDDGPLDEGVRQAVVYLARFPESGGRRSLALRAALTAAQLDDEAAARRCLQAAEEGPALSSDESLAAAEVHAELGQVERACALYEKRLEVRPGDPDALTGAGRLALRAGEVDRAERLLRDAVEAAPDRAAGRAALGLALIQKGEETEGASEMERALTLDPRQAEALFGLGFLAHQRRDHAGAVRYLRQALDRKPGYGQARIVLALALSDQGRCEEAIPLFTRALKADYSNLTLHAGLVRCLELTGRTAEASQARGVAEQLMGRTPPPGQ